MKCQPERSERSAVAVGGKPEKQFARCAGNDILGALSDPHHPLMRDIEAAIAMTDTFVRVTSQCSRSSTDD
jgi:hypothetical protein